MLHCNVVIHMQCNRTNPPFIRINRILFRMKILLQNTIGADAQAKAKAADGK